jgi:hypothetical protein
MIPKLFQKCMDIDIFPDCLTNRVNESGYLSHPGNLPASKAVNVTTMLIFERFN